jgi:putative inorganic carbon (HCO3(-)) transporter
VLPAALIALPLALAAALHPLIALLALAAGLLMLLVFLRAEAVLLVLVAALPWEDALAYPSEKVTLVKLLGLLLFGAWLLRTLARNEPLRLPGVLLPVTLLGAFVALSLIVSPDPAAGLLDFLRYALYIMFFFLVVQLTETRAQVERILRVFVLSAACASIWALYQFVVLGESRAGGPISDPNDFAYVMACVLPFAAHLLATERSRRWLWGVCFVVLCAAVLATLSRGALVGLGALAVWGTVTRRIPIGGVLLGVVALLSVIAVAFLIWAPQLQDRLAGKNRIADANVASRQAFWLGAVRMAGDRPLLGVGPGRFGAEAPAYVRNSPLAIKDPVVHNSYLHVLAEIGAFGLAAFLAFLVGTWRLLARARSRAIAEDDEEGRRLTTAMQAAMVVALVSATFLSVQLTTPFWLFGALATVVAGAPRPAQAPATPPRGRVATAR